MFLVPMDTPASPCGRSARCSAPHHLNEVFFDDVWAGPDAGARRDRRGLGGHPQGAGPRAGRHRPLRPLRAAAAPRSARSSAPALGRRCPPSLHTQWARALVQVRVARLLAYRTVHAQADRRAPRRARLVGPHRRHPVRPGGGRGAVPGRRGTSAVEAGSARRSTAPSRTTGATPRPPPSRRAPSRCSGSCWPEPCWRWRNERMVLDLSEDALSSARQALRAFEAAGGDQLVQPPGANRDAARRPWPVRCSSGSVPGISTPRTDARRAGSGGGAVPQRGLLGVPYPLAERLSRPADLDVDGLLVMADNRPEAPLVASNRAGRQ